MKYIEEEASRSKWHGRKRAQPSGSLQPDSCTKIDDNIPTASYGNTGTWYGISIARGWPSEGKWTDFPTCEHHGARSVLSRNEPNNHLYRKEAFQYTNTIHDAVRLADSRTALFCLCPPYFTVLFSASSSWTWRSGSQSMKSTLISFSLHCMLWFDGMRLKGWTVLYGPFWPFSEV